jgi:hypothetical protein
MASKKINELTLKYPLDGTEFIVAADQITGVAYKGYIGDAVLVGIGGGQIYATAGSFAYLPTSVTLSGNTNNLGFGQNGLIRIQSTGNYDLTGLVPIGGAAANAWRVIYILNRGTNTITLKHEDAASTAENRFFTHNGNNVSLQANHLVMGMYDEFLSRWRVWGLV